MRKRILSLLILAFTSGFFPLKIFSQPSWTIDLLGKEKKPEKFKERKLGSEKLAEKKFTKPRNFFQNTFTHYNYYYNANNKLNMVIERAKIAHKDDYTKPLSFYPYTLDNTANQESELDSVILKSTAGILLHDLRNDWIDNMYLLIGKAYFFKKNFDTAIATFQFINYNLFPRKKKNDDENKIVGTTDAASNSSISIATKEKQNFLQKIASQPPSRNDALVWLIRTLIEQEEFSEAAGLINTLQYDPNLPKRLRNDLEEVNAYWFYKQGLYDSTVSHLEKALSNSESKHDRSRWEFLLAQLYEATGKFDKASGYYSNASKLTTDPLMDIYAQLNKAKMFKGANPQELDKSIENLTHMAKKDKFESYRDILYFSAGQLAIEKPDTTAAIGYYKKSIKFSENPVYKNKALLRLADIAYREKQYKESFAYYDSLQSDDTTIADDLSKIQARRSSLSKIVEKINIIEREDSLQRIAAMPPAERDQFVKKLLRRLRKEKGMKEEDFSGGPLVSFEDNKDQPADLFATSNKGEWYFYNSSIKSKGFREFKAKWGTRANVDNWRRKSSTAEAQQPTALLNPGVMSPDEIDTSAAALQDAKKAEQGEITSQPVELSYDGLMANVPITEEKMAESKRLLSRSIFELAQLFQNDIEDCEEAIKTYDTSLKRFPDSLYDGAIYLGLYYCYNKLGNTAKADYYKNLLTSNFAESHSAKVLTNPALADPASNKNPEVTKLYEEIYNLFIEGRFIEALAGKQKADSLYGSNYWSPQLLYIQSVYHIKQHEDSVAKGVLKNIIELYPKSPLASKAERMIDVLGRRAEIEKYLTNLQITRYGQEDSIQVIEDSVVAGKPVQPGVISQPADSSKGEPVQAPVVKELKDTVKVIVKPEAGGPFVFNGGQPHLVVMILDKVDGTYVNEAKNALSRYNNERHASQSLTVTKDYLDATRTLLIFSTFPNADDAVQYYTKIRKAAPSEVSWLPANTYSFLVISDDNLKLLKTNKDIKGYKSLLSQQYPGMF